jgi:chromate transporter
MDRELNNSSPVFQVAALFTKLGCISFGGPLAHIALMREEVVAKRAWLTQEEFTDLISATNFIPGPNSTEMAIHIGHRVAGWRGLLAAGFCFIFPAALIVALIGWGYVNYGSLPAFQTFLYGIKPVIVAIVGLAIWNLGKSAIKNRWLGVLALFAAAINLLGVNELPVIAIAGIISAIFGSKDKKVEKISGFSLGANKMIWGGLATSSIAAGTVSFSKLFLFFLKVGSVLFGSGYVLLAFLRSDLVDRYHWLSEAQLLDAIAVGQFTPGPVFTTATFIGYILAGPMGALLSTVAIFLPAFFFVALSIPFLSQIRKSNLAAAALDGVNVASLAVMFTATLFLARAAFMDLFTVIVAALSLLLLKKYKLNSAWLVLAGGVLGFIWQKIILN